MHNGRNYVFTLLARPMLDCGDRLPAPYRRHMTGVIIPTTPSAAFSHRAFSRLQMSTFVNRVCQTKPVASACRMWETKTEAVLIVTRCVRHITNHVQHVSPLTPDLLMAVDTSRNQSCRNLKQARQPSGMSSLVTYHTRHTAAFSNVPGLHHVKIMPR